MQSEAHHKKADARDLERVIRLYAVLSRVNEAILRIRDQEELFEAACKIAVEDGGLILAWIGFLDPVSGRVRVAAKYGRDEGYLDNIDISLDPDVPEGQGPTALSLRECRPFINNDTANNPFMAPWRDAQLRRGFAASASFALVVNGGAIGVITLYAGEPYFFDDEEVRLLTSLADDFSFALEAAEVAKQREQAVAELERSRDELEVRVVERTAELRESEQRLRAELANTRLLQDVAEAGASAPELETVGREMLAAAERHVGIHAGDIRLLSPDGKSLRLLVSIGWPEVTIHRLQQVSVADSGWMASRVVVEGRVLTQDDEKALTAERMEVLREAGVLESRYIAMPLRYGDTMLGIMSLTFAGRRSFSPEERRLFESVAHTVAQSIENARLFEAEQTRRRRIESLHGAMEAGASSLELRASAKRMLDYLREREAFEMMTAWLVRGDVLDLIATAGLPPAYGEGIAPMALTSDYDIPKVFRSATPFVTPDVANGTPVVKELYERLGVDLGAYVIVPLQSRGTTIGALSIGWAQPRVFSAEDIDFFSSLGHEIGVVLENSRLFEAERDIADRLQEALLTMPEGIGGIEFAHAYHGAMETARVGGDFYDIFELNQHHVGITIGDVAGKGLDAAVLTSLVKNTIRAHANEKGKTPKRILELTNDVVFKSTATEAFVTVFFGILDCRDGRLVYGNAGHTTAAVVRADGVVGKLAVTGPLLGAFEDVEFDQAEARLDLDQLLFLYTDGLTEARRDGELYGEERLFEFLASTKNGPVSDVVREVVGEVVGYTGNRLRDDLAILALRRVEQGAETAQQQKLEM
jgi:GAF domain-containing protein